jgi:WD40 repeat protein
MSFGSSLIQHTAAVTGVAFGPYHRSLPLLLATCSADGAVFLWSIQADGVDSFGTACKLDAHPAGVSSLAFRPVEQCPDGEPEPVMLVTGGADGSVRLWLMLKGVGGVPVGDPAVLHSTPVTCATFAPRRLADGTAVLVTAAQREAFARVWHVNETGVAPVATLPVSSVVRAVAVHSLPASGTVLIAVGDDVGALTLWELSEVAGGVCCVWRSCGQRYTALAATGCRLGDGEQQCRVLSTEQLAALCEGGCGDAGALSVRAALCRFVCLARGIECSV